MGFINDLKLGNKAESFVIDILKGGIIQASPNLNKKQFPFYDLLIEYGGQEWKAEVKYDLYAHKSGNVAIEYYNPKSNKPSGLSITKSDFWIHVLTNPDKAFIVKTDNLKTFISRHKPFKIIEVGGDGNASLLLYRTDFMLENIFIPIEPNNIRATLEILTKR
jgi:hypothetical protein